MNTTQHELDVSLFEPENESLLRRYTNQLPGLARICVDDPREENAIKACKASRNVWHTAEGMVHEDDTIPSDLLSEAIDGLGRCADAVIQMQPLFSTSPEILFHLQRMAQAITERKDDLQVLHSSRKMAFLRRLQQRRLGQI